MKITVSYSSVTQVEYEFDKWEVERALIALIKLEQPDKLLKGGFWTHEWCDKEGLSGDTELVFFMRQKVAEPCAEEET